MRVQAYMQAAAKVAASPSSRPDVIRREMEDAKHLSQASKDTLGSELFSVTDRRIAPFFGVIHEFACEVQTYERGGTHRREHALQQEIIRLVRTILGDDGAASTTDALKRAKARFAECGDYDPLGYVRHGSPGRHCLKRM
jgi:hypothetical protein